MTESGTDAGQHASGLGLVQARPMSIGATAATLRCDSAKPTSLASAFGASVASGFSSSHHRPVATSKAWLHARPNPTFTPLEMTVATVVTASAAPTEPSPGALSTRMTSRSMSGVVSARPP